ncbi:DUF6458 family protein [Bailinhaonella thermotolerans]|uniref:DUF6458 domain-containing protein n=1 Tax=Bailinhaonella thermotolerans TaxID=1070861 RepID=A0A3A4BIE7_9ACTN|nr:DUF6458 family protein [Bailinhaonella thermotolerans]RJL31032.1 hypothetical protein D5H75_21980 [Bailinhaonella thermotolerans]
MGIGVSIFLITLGAILRFAITAEVPGIDIQNMGVILMVVGGIGVVLSVLFMTRRGRTAEDDLMNNEGPPRV